MGMMVFEFADDEKLLSRNIYDLGDFFSRFYSSETLTPETNGIIRGDVENICWFFT